MEKNLNVRVRLKYDSYANWTTNNPILNKGEVAIATLENNSDGVVNAPSLLMKVGDGVNHYKDLSFLSAKSADVYSWAKKSEPEFIEWVRELISSEGVYDEKGAAEQALTDAKAYTDELANGAVKTNAEAIAAINADYLKGADKTELEGKITQALTDAKAYADGKDTAIANAQAKADAVDAKIGEVAEGKTVVDLIEESMYDDEEVRQGIADNASAIDAIEADYLKEADKTELQGKITENTTSITELSSTVDTKFAEAKSYTDTAISNLLDGADDTTLDSINELAKAIKENDSAIDALNEIAGSKASQTELEALQKVVEANTEAIEDQATQDATTYETKEDAASKLTEAKGYTDTVNTAMDTRVSTIEAKPAMDITSEQITTWDNGVQTITADTGLKAEKSGTDVTISLDDSVTFLFNCGNSAIGTDTEFTD